MSARLAVDFEIDSDRGDGVLIRSTAGGAIRLANSTVLDYPYEISHFFADCTIEVDGDQNLAKYRHSVEVNNAESSEKMDASRLEQRLLLGVPRCLLWGSSAVPCSPAEGPAANFLDHPPQEQGLLPGSEVPPDAQEGTACVAKCLKCKTRDAEYECDPCGCASWCRACAMKVASGGKCRQCGSFFGGVRQLRLQQFSGK